MFLKSQRTMRARAKWGKSGDTAPLWLRMGSPVWTRGRTRAPGVAARVAAAVAGTAAGSRCLRRTRRFRPRGTSSPRATTTASVKMRKEGHRETNETISQLRAKCHQSCFNLVFT